MRNSREGLQPRAIQCSSRTRSTGPQRRLISTTLPPSISTARRTGQAAGADGALNAPGAVERDAIAHVAFLDAPKEVDKTKKIGTQGYCMGGPLVVRTAAAVPDRVGAGGSFHGGGLLTENSDSPHLLAPKIKARTYFGIAGNDDTRQPDAKDKLKEAFAAAHVPAEIEVYTSLHGWCVPDMPPQNGMPRYNMADAARDSLIRRLAGRYRSSLPARRWKILRPNPVPFPR
jgi:dienelactone hydrolase